MSTTLTTHPNDLIESMTGRRHLSWSQLQSFRRCPRQWHYSHVEHAEPEFVSVALLLGSGFHAAAQHYYEQRLAGGTTDIDTLKDVFTTTWSAESTERDREVKYGKDDDQDTLADLARRMFESFLASDLANLPGDLIAIEETVKGTIHSEMPDLMARIDVAWVDDAGTHLMDLKTARSRWSNRTAQDNAEQLLLYHRLVRDLDPDQDLQLHFGVVTKAKTPAVQNLDLEVDEGRVERSIDLMLPVWNAMQAGVDYANPNPMNCSGCGFRGRCPAG